MGSSDVNGRGVPLSAADSSMGLAGPAWPDASGAALRMDAEQLTRLAGRLRARVEELRGSGSGGVADFASRTGGVSGSGAFGSWMTADQLAEYHRKALGIHTDVFGSLLDQALQVLNAVEKCADNVTEADLQTKSGFDAVAAGVSPSDLSASRVSADVSGRSLDSVSSSPGAGLPTPPVIPAGGW